MKKIVALLVVCTVIVALMAVLWTIKITAERNMFVDMCINQYDNNQSQWYEVENIPFCLSFINKE